MTTDPKRVKDIFLAAAELSDEAAQVAYLEQVCGVDAGLRERVEALLRSHDPAGSFLGTPAAALADSDVAAQQTIDSACCGGPGHEKEAEDIGFLSPPTRPDSLGRIGHYEALQVLGNGGFGIVLRAFDDILQRVVAIKVMAPHLAATSPARKRFLREARSSAQVRHENVVQVYEVAEQPLPYLVMEFIPGETLQQRLDRKGPLEIQETLRIGRQIAEGLAAAHATDLIHRDIKPGNVLLEGGQHKAKITDFGLARAVDDASMTQTGMIAGTPMYMAPEQALGQTLDQRADLFSLGSVLYQMASGRAPFRANSTIAVLKRVAEDTPRNIREIIPETPQWLCDIISKLHAKKPEDRYQSAREVADVLANCEAQLKEHSRLRDFSRIPKSKQPAAGKSGRGKWVAAAALLLPMIALAVAEFAGVTHLFRSGATGDLTKSGGGPTPAQVARRESSPAGDWVPLFNGQDLTGWKTDPLAPGDWGVEDGVIVGRGDTSSLFYDSKEYDNFHLRVEAKISTAGDSGIFFRVPLDMRVYEGYEAQIAVRSNYPVHTGSLLSRVDPSSPLQRARLMPHRPDEWFVLEVIADGNHLQTRVNGLITADYREDKQTFVRGHIALGTWGKNITFVQFRKIEIKELPASNTSPPASKRQFASDEWIDMIPLIDPQADKWNMQLTGKNDWRVEQGELIAGADDKASKLLLPIDAAWQAFECEVEFTRRSGPGGINVNIPTSVGDCPVVLGPPKTTGVFLGRNGGGVVLNKDIALVTGERTKLRFDVRRESNQDHVSVWVNNAAAGTWQGDRASIATVGNEGYPHARRLSLWVHAGGNEFVFHRIRVRMLDGGRADTLRPVPNPQSPPSPLTPGSLPPTFKNSLGMEFAVVPKGKSWLGGGQDKLGDQEVEIPADFYLGKYEVTQEEWEKVRRANPSYHSRKGTGKDAMKDVPDADLKRFPVEAMSWLDCQAFVKALNEQENEAGWVYRLPTQVEWEYACRGGPTADRAASAFDFYLAGPTNEPLADQANMGMAKNRPCKVGSYGPNPLGLFDMHGNVWEWCEDAEKGADGTWLLMFRGGSYRTIIEDCRAGNRVSNGSSHHSYNIGLRLARVPSGAPPPEAKTPSPRLPIHNLRRSDTPPGARNQQSWKI